MIDKWIIVGVAHFSLVAVILKFLGLILPCCITCYYSHIANFILYLYVAKFTFDFTKKYHLNERLQPENRAVFITGCDTGFGHDIAKRLDSIGYPVFAGCLFPEGEGAKELKNSCSKRLQVIEIDVTNDESVKKAAEFVRENLGTSELSAIVNNAGILKGFSVELTSLDDFRDTLEVNTFGLVRVTKAFLPMLRQSRGRVVNITSAAGRYPLAHVTPYTMSKFAAVAFNDCLKQEMDVWGVRVIDIEPELFATALTNPELMKNRVEESISKIEQDIKDDYGEKYIKNLINSCELFCNLKSQNSKPVVEAVESAISLEYPNAVYQPCRNIIFQVIAYIALRIPASVQFCFYKLCKIIIGFPVPKEALNYF